MIRTCANMVLLLIMSGIFFIFPWKSHSQTVGSLTILIGVSIVWFVVLSHDDEFLQFTLPLLFVYSLLGALGMVVIWRCPHQTRDLLLLLVVPSFGVPPLLVPGLLRCVLRCIVPRFWLRKPGSLEGALLLTTYVPRQIGEMYESKKYSLWNRRMVLWLKDVMRIELVLALIVAFLHVLYQLAAATVNRRFQVIRYIPSVDVSVVEWVVYMMGIGTVAWLFIEG